MVGAGDRVIFVGDMGFFKDINWPDSAGPKGVAWTVFHKYYALYINL